LRLARRAVPLVGDSRPLVGLKRLPLIAALASQIVKHVLPIAGLLLLPAASADAQTVPSSARPGVPVLAPTLLAPPTVTLLPQPVLASSLPPPPEVTDPMLGPVRPPKRVVQSWNEAVAYLRARSTNLKIAVDQVLTAQAQTTIALAQYLPSLGGCSGSQGLIYGCSNPTFTHQFLTEAPPPSVISAAKGVNTGNPNSAVQPPPNVFNASLNLSQDIINFSEWDQIWIDKLSERAANQTVEDTKRTLELSLATQVVSVVTAERTAEINRTGLRVALEQSELTRRKAADGAATQLDVVRARQNAANARAALVAGDEVLRQAREGLGLILGFPEETGISPALRMDGFASDALGACRAVDTVDERPDILAARTNLEVAKRNLRNVWFTFLPTLTGQASLSGTSVPAQYYPNPTFSITAILSVPLWDGGTRMGSLKNARANEDIALQNLDGAKRAAIIGVEQAQRGIEVAEVSARVAGEQRDLAAQNDTMTQTAWMHGQGTSVDLVTASEAHRQAELSLALADFNVVKARLAATLALATCPW
jgi:outer membrane protein, multidrug efflux system